MLWTVMRWAKTDKVPGIDAGKAGAVGGMTYDALPGDVACKPG